MIPVQLQIKNFLPYRSPDPVHFDGIHLACLTGANGAGKSSLLDAITWALWGKARAKRDDELVHMGQADMYVQLDFEQEGIVYRVLRRRTSGKRGQSALDLFVLQEDSTPTTISEPGMNLTQEKINGLLRLDYETFIHSAFLQQGKADAFTVKRPAERKKILSDILGLDRWADYEDAAKDRLKGISDNLAYFENRIREIDEELARKPALETELKNATHSYQEAEAARVAAEARMKEVEHAPGDLTNAQTRKADRLAQSAQHERELEEVTQAIQTRQARIQQYETFIDSQDEIESGYHALQNARSANQAMSDKLMQLTSLKDDRAALQSQIDTARTRLESEVENIQQRIAELETIIEVDYDTELEAVYAEVMALQQQEIERDRTEDGMNSMREELASVKATFEAVETEGKALRERLQRLQATDEETAICPLCGQPLDSEHLEQVTLEVQETIETRRKEYVKHRERIAALNDQIQEKRGFVDKLNVEIKRLPPLRERVGMLQTQAQAVDEARTRLASEQDQLAYIQQQLADGAYAQDVRVQLAELNNQQDALGYDQSTHDDAREQLEVHLRYEHLHTQLQIALETIESLQENLNSEQARQARLEKAIADSQAAIDAIDLEMARLVALVQEFNARKEEVEIERTRERTAYDRLSAARQGLNALEAQAERKAELELKRAHARQQEALYNELKAAFGKNGVPAMVIETAIPELEAAANELLARMTDGRMHLRMNTQREKVTGGIAETLDIEIADELGTRSYEMYSGGEAFRINFAIRVALSQMLARRAGAHLRTLFIDEGFGTQDEEGRSKLVEAINVIQDQFDMILVITHIDDLRDSFPVHIVVDKTSNGSRIGLR